VHCVNTRNPVWIPPTPEIYIQIGILKVLIVLMNRWPAGFTCDFHFVQVQGLHIGMPAPCELLVIYSSIWITTIMATISWDDWDETTTQEIGVTCNL